MDKKSYVWVLPLLGGFSVSFLVALFVRFGVPFVLYLLDWWQVSTVSTIILYGMLFIVVRVVVQVQTRRPKSQGKRKADADGVRPADRGARSVGILSIVWSFLTIYILLWLTPALIIYWVYGPAYPHQIVMLFVYLSSVASALVYYYTNTGEPLSLIGKAVYFAGACLGLVAAAGLIQ